MAIIDKSEQELFQHMIDNPGWDKTAEQYISRWRRVYRNKDVPEAIGKKFVKLHAALSKYRAEKKAKKA